MTKGFELLAATLPQDDGSPVTAGERERLELELARLQREARASGVPIMLLFEGWDAAGKGTVINALMSWLDPRGARVVSAPSPSPEDSLRPHLQRFWMATPAKGAIALFDRGWYDRVLDKAIAKSVSPAQLQRNFAEIRAFERTLVDDGTLLVKFVFHISKREQSKRFKKLREHKATAWRIDRDAKRQNAHYPAWLTAYETAVAETLSEDTPWVLVPAKDKQQAIMQVLRELVKRLSARLDTPAAVVPSAESVSPNLRISSAESRLATVDLARKLTPEAYEEEVDALKRRLFAAGHLIYSQRLPVVVAYEGWDAAGKGGSIRRLTTCLDPRGYEVTPISAPTQTEKSQHYLWRFWSRLPKAGHVTIFDRSWYGRVLVERVEGFCSSADWRRAYAEIREFERNLVDWGAVVVKFWLQIDKDEQLARFEARQQRADKRWKITEEDWRNREKWDLYEAAVADMLELTEQAGASWTVVPGNDKRLARVFALRALTEAIEARLE